MTLASAPPDERVLDRLEERIRNVDPHDPALASLRRLRSDHVAILRENVAMLRAEADRMSRAA